MEFTYETLKFKEENDFVLAKFLKFTYFKIPKKSLSRIGKYKVENGNIIFEENTNRIERKFNELIDHGLSELKHTIKNKPVIYIHKNSGIPLIGTVNFGLVDRNTSCIEVKPSTSCNLECTYCSVNDDTDRRPTDFIIEPDYLVEEFKKLAEFKGVPVEAHIQSQGEPLLYSELIRLVKGLSKIELCKSISVDTNGVLLNTKLVDDLISAGLTRFNVSLDAMEQKKAEEIAGCTYNLQKVLDVLKYISTKSNLIVAPVWIPGLNDDQIDELIKFVKSLKNDKFHVSICIQNFLNYSNGRNPTRQKTFKEFYEDLAKLEKKHDIKLAMSKLDFEIVPTKPTPVPFKRNDIIKAQIIGPGRLKEETLASASNRVISIFNTDKTGLVNVRIKRSLNNIFIGEIV